jgi:hypothetical protein
MGAESITIDRDLRRIRVQRLIAAVLLLLAPLFLLSFGRVSLDWWGALAFAWLLAFLIFGFGSLYAPCPKCSRPFFIPSNPESPSWWILSQFESNPFRESCAHCGQPLNPR